MRPLNPWDLAMANKRFHGPGKVDMSSLCPWTCRHSLESSERGALRDVWATGWLTGELHTQVPTGPQQGTDAGHGYARRHQRTRSEHLGRAVFSSLNCKGQEKGAGLRSTGQAQHYPGGRPIPCSHCRSPTSNAQFMSSCCVRRSQRVSTGRVRAAQPLTGLSPPHTCHSQRGPGLGGFCISPFN